jgi:hypothetical protein
MAKRKHIASTRSRKKRGATPSRNLKRNQSPTSKAKSRRGQGKTSKKQNSSKGASSIERRRSSIDRGDDMQRRIEYQAQYAAVKSLELLKADSKFQYFYCEHHEDLLFKRADGTLMGLQVKTRDDHLSNFKSTDEARFLDLKRETEEFQRFVIAVNKAFERSATKHDIRFLVAKSNLKTISIVIKSYFSSNFRKSKNRKSFKLEELRNVLKVCEIDDNLPKFEDAETDLCRRIANLGFRGHSWDTIEDAARSLTTAMREASALKGTRVHSAIFEDDPSQALTDNIIQQKKITRTRVLALLNGILQGDLPMARKPPTVKLAPLSSDEATALLTAMDTTSAGLLRWPSSLANGISLSTNTLNVLLQRVQTSGTSTSLLLGAPGSGKSVVLGNLVRTCIASGFKCMALKCDQLPGDLETSDRLAEYIGVRDDISVLLARLALSEKVLLVLDQLDALSDLTDARTTRLNILLELMKNLTGHPGLHIVASVRDIDARHDPRLSDLPADRLDMELPPWEEVKQLLISVNLPTDHIEEGEQLTLQNPQNLKLHLKLSAVQNG